MLSDYRLRKISENIFQEIEPPKDGSRPLEWRIGLHTIILSLKQVEIHAISRVHDIEFEIGLKSTNEYLRTIKPDISSSLIIKGRIDERGQKDHIYCAVEDKENKDIFSFVNPSGPTIVTLRPGSPTEEEKDRISKGIYVGHAFRMDYMENDDNFYYELTMPQGEINHLIEALRRDDKSTMEVGVHLMSYTFEVDDAFCEPWHHRDYIVDDTGLCFLAWATVKTKINDNSLDISPDEDTDSLFFEAADEPKISFEQQSHQEYIQILSSYQKPLKSLTLAIWTLVFVIIGSVFIQ